ncbi:LuxR C-terminal-related transcriptional regulator [Pseudomonas nitroreducens]|uniref:LuxR C-terminal-related transcriptional regulator n=1 Tax=Pseudomonas nitroreducens TaxID=46680 RepID=UPI003CC81071
MDTRPTTTNQSPAVLNGNPTFDSVDSSKLTPPRNSGRIVARERLHTQLQEARRKRCIVIKGPAGCGKTTALVAWRQLLLPLGFDVAWLGLSSDENQPMRFLDYLLASLAQVEPAMVRDAALLEGYGSDREAAENTVITLVQGIAGHPRDVVLVLDDLHALSDPEIHQTLQWLLDYAPSNLHLVLVSRSAIPLSLARLRSHGLVLELDLRDLRFTPTEAEAFLRAQLGEVDSRDVQSIYEMTDGWIAGLQLVAASYKKSRQRLSGPGRTALLPQEHLSDNQAFARFFAAEVLSHLSPTNLELLLHTAVCSRFCAPLCATLVGRPEAIGEARELLQRLENDNLFLIAIDGGEAEVWYRLHPLLRETLLQLFAARPEEQRQAVHTRAWEWLRDHEQMHEAIRHAVLGGRAADAAELVEQRVDDLTARGEIRFLIDLVQQLPLEQLQPRISLRLVLARMQIYTRDLPASEKTLQELDRDVPPSDPATRFRITVLRAAVAVQRDDTDQAMAYLPELLAPPVEADGFTVGGGINILSWLYMHHGEFERARRLQIDRPTMLVDGSPLRGTASGTLLGRALIGLSLAMEGQMIQAERIYREVIYEAERGGRPCIDALFLATALLGEALYESNEAEAAYQLLADRVDAFERMSIPDSVLRVLEVLGKCQWLAGNHREAFAYLDRLDEYARRLGLDRLQAHSLQGQILWHLQLGELVAAESKLARLESIAARHVGSGPGASREIHALAENARIRWQIAQGDLLEAVRRLTLLIDFCDSGGRQLDVTRLKMLAAILDEQRGLPDAARDKVLAALRAGHRYGQVRSLLDTHPRALQLIDQVANGSTLDPVLRFYVERLQAIQDRASRVSAGKPAETRRQAAATTEPLSEREMEVLRLLAQALPNKKIARALGLSHETVKWHLRHIYSKLGVGSRDEAVARLRDMESAV